MSREQKEGCFVLSHTLKSSRASKEQNKERIESILWLQGAMNVVFLSFIWVNSVILNIIFLVFNALVRTLFYRICFSKFGNHFIRLFEACVYIFSIIFFLKCQKSTDWNDNHYENIVRFSQIYSFTSLAISTFRSAFEV